MACSQLKLISQVYTGCLLHRAFPGWPPRLPVASPPSPPNSAWDYLRTLGLQKPRHVVSHNPVSWLKSMSLSMSLSKTRPHVASQQVASQSPNTYHKIQSSGMFQASALGKSQEKSLVGFHPRGWGRESESKMEAARGGRDLGILLNVAAPQGPQAWPAVKRCLITPGQSQLHRHQGETALGYH